MHTCVNTHMCRNAVSRPPYVSVQTDRHQRKQTRPCNVHETRIYKYHWNMYGDTIVVTDEQGGGVQIQRVSFIARHSTPPLSHTKPASAASSRYSCGVQDSDKKYAQYRALYILCPFLLPLCKQLLFLLVCYALTICFLSYPHLTHYYHTILSSLPFFE